MKHLLKYERQKELMTYLFDYAMLCINKTQKRNGRKVAFSLSTRKATSESLNIILTAKVYNSLLHNHIQLEIEKILRKKSK